MRIVVDYRPALKGRTGVGEYVHEATRAFTALHPEDSMTLFTSSWKDRPSAGLSAELRANRLVDWRLPVQLLNYTWHNLEWPAIESLTHERYDVAFSPHPLLLPARRAAQVVMIHDLDFIRAPERTGREIRRDYPRLSAQHAHRAAHIVVPSRYTASDVVATLGVSRERVTVCPPGMPRWCGSAPAKASPQSYVLFVGTLDARKNIGGLLRAYGRLLSRRPDAPSLVLAGSIPDESVSMLAPSRRAPLAGRVKCLGYVPEAMKPDVYSGARVLILPSLDEGFGMPALEAMSMGIPVIVSRCGALPEVVGDAGLLVDPHDDESIACALERVLTDDDLAQALASRGRLRAAAFQWTRTATLLREAFTSALERYASTRTITNGMYRPYLGRLAPQTNKHLGAPR